jgi:predicted transcriptional regulator
MDLSQKLDLEKVKDKIEELGVKKSFVAKKIGITNVMFSYYLNGRKSISKEKEFELQKFLNL